MARRLILVAIIILIRAALSVVTGGWRNHASGTPMSALAEKQSQTAKSKGPTAEELNAKLLAKLNERRPTGSFPLLLDKDLSKWLSSNVAKVSRSELKDLGTLLESQMPRYVACQGYASYSSTLAGTYAELLQDCRKLASIDNCAGIHSTRTANGQYRTVMVACHRAAAFSPEALSDHRTEALLSTCPSCRATHLWRSTHVSSVLSLGCPHCKTTYAILAPDNQGSYRYVNEFLTGYEPPAKFPPQTDKLKEMLIIWQAVWDDCAYQRDGHSSVSSRESWQPGVETMVRQTGDCEDTSILAADWLISRGFEARVAIGKAGPKAAGHAWVVVLVDGVCHILESTSQPPPKGVTPTVSLMGANYLPEAMFDREAIYFVRDRKIPFDNNYWSSNWRRVVPRPRKLPGAPEPAVVKNVASANEGHPIGMPVPSVLNKPVAAPLKTFTKLATISPGAAWQIDVPSLLPTTVNH